MTGTNEKQLSEGKVTYLSPKESQLEMKFKAEAPDSLKLYDPPCKHTNAPASAAQCVLCP